MANFLDSLFQLRDDGNPTRIAMFQLAGISNNTTRTLTVQDRDGIIALLSDIANASVETLNTATPATAAAFTPAVSTVGYYWVDLSLSVRTTQASVQATLKINWTDNGGAQTAYIVQPTDTATRQSSKRLLIYLASGSLTYTTTFTGFGVGRVDVRAKAQRII